MGRRLLASVLLCASCSALSLEPRAPPSHVTLQLPDRAGSPSAMCAGRDKSSLQPMPCGAPRAQWALVAVTDRHAATTSRSLAPGLASYVLSRSRAPHAAAAVPVRVSDPAGGVCLGVRGGWPALVECGSRRRRAWTVQPEPAPPQRALPAPPRSLRPRAARDAPPLLCTGLGAERCVAAPRAGRGASMRLEGRTARALERGERFASVRTAEGVGAMARRAQHALGRRLRALGGKRGAAAGLGLAPGTAPALGGTDAAWAVLVLLACAIVVFYLAAERAAGRRGTHVHPAGPTSPISTLKLERAPRAPPRSARARAHSPRGSGAAAGSPSAGGLGGRGGGERGGEAGEPTALPGLEPASPRAPGPEAGDASPSHPATPPSPLHAAAALRGEPAARSPSASTPGGGSTPDGGSTSTSLSATPARWAGVDPLALAAELQATAEPDLADELDELAALNAPPRRPPFSAVARGHAELSSAGLALPWVRRRMWPPFPEGVQTTRSRGAGDGLRYRYD